MIKELFEKHDNEYLKFHRVIHKYSQRHDLHAFILLDKIFPSNKNIICYAEHDRIWLESSVEELTENQIVDLVRCGVQLEDDSLWMWV